MAQPTKDKPMTDRFGYFCPVAMAAEIIGPRWSMSLLSEMLSGSVRFNEIRRGVPRMSPALLSKRLKELQEWGLVERRPTKRDGLAEYHLTAAAEELRPIIVALGCWSHKWVDTALTLENLDPRLLMWQIRRCLTPIPAPRRKTVIQITYPELPKKDRHFWLIVAPGQEIDLCSIDPGFDVDLYVTSDLRAMTKAHMGHSTFDAELRKGTIKCTGDDLVRANLRKWFGQSIFAEAAPLASD
jgi:DNA-binding HxlR family transcriptional regulator